VKCLRNGLGKRLSERPPTPGRPEPVVSGRPAVAGEKNRASTTHPEVLGCILPTVGNPKRKFRLNGEVSEKWRREEAAPGAPPTPDGQNWRFRGGQGQPEKNLASTAHPEAARCILPTCPGTQNGNPGELHVASDKEAHAPKPLPI